VSVQKKQHGRANNANEHLGLLANGSSGGWDVAVDETTKGPDRWFVQFEGPSIYFSFEVPSPAMICGALAFLEGRSSPKGRHVQLSVENGSLVLGRLGQTDVVLVRDDEYKDRFFLLVGQEADAVVRFTLAGQDLKDVKEALRQAMADLEDEG
jgi:hypothetical protein